MFANIQSQNGNKASWIFSFDFGWSRAYPMKTKSAPHLMFEGVPLLMVMDGSKEHTLGKFCQTIRHAGFEQKTTKPYSP